MSETEPQTDPTTEPQAPAEQPKPTPPAKKSLEDLLGGLDDDARGVILGEVSKARNEAKGLRDRLKEAEPKVSEYDRLAEASKTEQQRAQEAADKATKRAESLLARAVNAEVKAIAAAKFADPADAGTFLGDLSKYANEEGEVDTAAIESDLSDLLGRKPYLAKDTSRLPKPNAAQGSSGSGPATPAQLSKQDVDRLYAERKYDEIEKARVEGRLTHLLGA